MAYINSIYGSEPRLWHGGGGFGLGSAAWPPVDVGDPRFEQPIGHGQNHRSHEQPDDAKADETADYACDDEEQGQVRAALDQDRAHDVVEQADRHAPDEQHGAT
jgi:hypothetical protein